jgi:hypothetical protein
VRGSSRPSCPACGSKHLERQFSLPTVHSTGTHDKARRAAKKRDAKRAARRVRAQQEYERHHDDH